MYLKELDETLVYGKDVSKEDVDNFLGMVALLYAVANIDDIVVSEQQVINLYKYNITRALDRLRHKDLRDTFYEHLENLEEIESTKDTIKLSTALKYFPKNNEGLSEKIKTVLQDLSDEVIEVDGKITPQEIAIQQCIKMYLEKGNQAISKIEEMEKSCY